MRHSYFAYGSNLDAEQMRTRCPEARLLGPAALSGHRLAFTGHSATWGGAVATLCADPQRHVAGLLWSLSDADLEHLDRREGYPTVYQRRPLRVQRPGGLEEEALVYLKVDARPARPTEAYLALIRRAYQRHGFDPAALTFALEVRP